MNKTPAPSAARMRSLALDFPAQLEEGFRSALELAATPRTARHAVVVGMGGSAIAADLARNVTDPETDLPLSVTRGPMLPRFVGAESWAIFASYSGQTWETLNAYDEARRRGAARLAISSGGELARRAERDGVPHLMLPPGLPPRAALGYMLGGLLGSVDPFFPESNEARLQRSIARLHSHGPILAKPGGVADELAAAIDGRIPFIYTDASFDGLARRWKTQIEENAKCLAQFDLVPELFHNALVAWDALPASEAKRRAVVLLEWSGESAATKWGFRYLEKLLRERDVKVSHVALDPEDRLDAVLEGVALGDHLSLFLAERLGADPMPVEAIVRLKKAQEIDGPSKPAVRPHPGAGPKRPSNSA